MNDAQTMFSGKVLVVDDDFAVQIIASETLEQAGFSANCDLIESVKSRFCSELKIMMASGWMIDVG